jgi:hypothetical protein
MYKCTTVQKEKKKDGEFSSSFFFMWIAVNWDLLVLFIDMACQHYTRPSSSPPMGQKKKNEE